MVCAVSPSAGSTDDTPEKLAKICNNFTQKKYVNQEIVNLDENLTCK